MTDERTISYVDTFWKIFRNFPFNTGDKNSSSQLINWSKVTLQVTEKNPVSLWSGLEWSTGSRQWNLRREQRVVNEFKHMINKSVQQIHRSVLDGFGYIDSHRKLLQFSQEWLLMEWMINVSNQVSLITKS